MAGCCGRPLTVHMRGCGAASWTDSASGDDVRPHLMLQQVNCTGSALLCSFTFSHVRVRRLAALTRVLRRMQLAAELQARGAVRFCFARARCFCSRVANLQRLLIAAK
jgi:hypothetical protein|eukprot:COSAG01_NODE_2079_length_8464_cov_7.812821_7_plen_108_part_00